MQSIPARSFARAVIVGAALTVAPLVIAQGAAMEIAVAPRGFVYVVDAAPGRGWRDVMIHTIALRNDGDAVERLEMVEIEFLGADGARLAKTVPAAQALRATAGLAEPAAQGLDIFLRAQLLAPGGLEEVFGANSVLGDDVALAPGAALLLTSQYAALDFEPERIRITARYATVAGEMKITHAELATLRHEPAIKYRFPLEGRWIMRGFPNIRSHHRFIPSNEFALDFFKTGEDGALDRGARATPEDDYGYGEPVLAAASGEVALVIDDQIQEPEKLAPMPGESREDAIRRITQYQFGRYAENFLAAAAGNVVVLRHEASGRIEYSSYGHLRAGSVAVAVGDRVSQGEKIAEVGHTGDSTLTHLHFQINAGPDPVFSRGIPAAFSNIRPLYQGQDPGLFVETFTDNP